MKSRVFSTPLGWAGAAASDKGITRVVLPKKSRGAAARELSGCAPPTRRPAGLAAAAGAGAACPESGAGQLLDKAVVLLQQYFSGKPVAFDLPLDTRGGTEFQQAVWRACARIPSGTTRSYGWLAERINRSGAARAVGQAMGANPVPVLVP